MNHSGFLKNSLWFAVLVLLVAGVAFPSRAQTVIAGNLGPGNTYQSGTGMAWATGPGAPPCNNAPCDPANAVGFTIPVGGPHYLLTQVKIAANWSAGTDSVLVGLYVSPGPNTAASINSAKLLHSFTLAATTQFVAQLFTVQIKPILLIPGNTYFIEMTEPNNGNGTNWGWQWNNQGQNGYYAEFLNLSNPSWIAETVVTPAFEVDGTPITTPVFVSTHQGGQILVVDGDTPGTVASVYSASCDGPCPVQPEGIVVGPDGKIYMADPTHSTIRRIDRSGANIETLFTSCVVSPCPTGPQAPSFSSSPAGDLYFVDPGPLSSNTNDVFMVAGAAKAPVGGPFSNPAVVLKNCGLGSKFCEQVLGGGTAFDMSDNLLFDGAYGLSGGKVWSSPPPYNVASAVVALASVTSPGAIALNKSTGQIFVVSGQDILSIGTTTTTTYYTFTSADIPRYMQFDAAGRLFVATAQFTTYPYHGKVWRVDPPGSSATLLVDLNSAYSSGENSLGLFSDQADGVALPPTPYPAISIPLNPLGGTNRYTYANGLFDYKIVYGPPTPANPNVNLVVQAIQETQQQLDAFTAGTGFAGATLAPYFGTGGYGIRFVATCQDVTTPMTPVTIPCPQFLDPYEVVTNYNGVLPTNVAFLTGEDSLPYDSNILTSASALRTGDPTIAGHKKPRLSGFQVAGGVTGTPPTITITSPTNTTYALNQVVLASYTCTGQFVTQCLGTVTSGMAIDTTSAGTKTFLVNANVSQGPSASLTVMYTVISGPVASVSPSSVNFGNVKAGRFAFAVVKLTNTGQAPLHIKSVKTVSVSNGDSDDFFAFSFCPNTLAVGNSCSIWVFFYADRDSFKPQSATLVIIDDAPGSPQLIPLTATVVNGHEEE